MTNEATMKKDLTSLWMEWQRDFWGSWMSATTKGIQSTMPMWQGSTPLDMFGEWYQSWLKSVLEPSIGKVSQEGLGATVYNRILRASSVYADLLVFWARSTMLLAQIPPGTTMSAQRLKEVYDQWIKDYQSMMGSLWGTSPSEDIQETVKAYQNATGVSAEHAWHLMEPVFKNLEQFPGILAKMSRGEGGAAAELTGLLRKNYEVTLSRILRAPSMGYFGEFNERVSRTVDTYIRFNAALAEYYTPFYQTGLRAAEKVFQRLMEFEGKEITPETFREFYRIWWTINEDVYYEMFQSEEFTKVLGELLRQGLLYKKQLDELTDEVVQFTNLPTKRDMDEVYQSIYELKKEVRWQRRAIKDFEQHLGIQVMKPSPM